MSSRVGDPPDREHRQGPQDPPESRPSTPHLLLCTSDDDAERVIELGEKVVVGRGADSDVVVSHPSVSRHHIELLRREGGSYVVSDLGSLNGTLLNGRRLQGQRELYHGDGIGIGELTLVFLHPGGPARPEVDQGSFDQLRAAEPSAEALASRESATLVMLACDVRGYASLTEKLPALELQAFVDEWVEVAFGAAQGCGATRESSATDVMCAYWVVSQPEAPAVEVDSALRAASRICEHAGEYAEEFGRRFSFGSFEISIGLHIGPAWFVRMSDGSTKVSGEAVSLALGLADLPRDGTHPVVLSWAVAQWAPAQLRLRNLGALQPRGHETRVSALALDVTTTG